jgi:hypothetical protein
MIWSNYVCAYQPKKESPKKTRTATASYTVRVGSTSHAVGQPNFFFFLQPRTFFFLKKKKNRFFMFLHSICLMKFL